MKHLTFFLSFFIITCVSTEKLKSEDLGVISTNWCPENGKCSIEELSNKKLTLNTDEFGNSYTEITEGTKTLYVFEFIKNQEPDTEDSAYKELVYLELETLNESFKASGKDLKTYNPVYTRLCFCRGQTGSYNITEGKLEYTKETNYLKFTFQNNKVPQLINYVEVYL
jgi:hypothetical protein